MQKGPGRFELTLNLQEVIVLFFVMIALFTGLLFFGYRVGYTQSANAMQLPSAPVTPTQENPPVEKQTPGVEVEPEIRLENSPAKPTDQPFGPAEAKPGNPDLSGEQPLARQFSEPARRPCKSGSYLSFLQKGLPAKHRLSKRLADWAGAPLDDATRSRLEPAEKAEAAIAADSGTGGMQGREPDVDCTLPAGDPRTSRSVAC